MATMKALYQDAFGDATKVFKFGTLPAPGEPGPTQVLVQVRAAALNPVDIKRADGMANNMGLANDTFPIVIGYDLAGVVSRVGSAVTRLVVGDEVYGDIHAVSMGTRTTGAIAEVALVEADLLAKKPAALSWAAAAALPVAVLTAQAAYDAVKLAAGEKLLVTAGAGGVGHVAIQLAKSDAYRAGTVATTASAAKADFVRSVGADVVVDYRSSSPAAELSGYDAVLELTGEMEAVLPVLAPAAAGRVAGVATFTPDERWVVIQLAPTGANLERLAGVLEAGQVVPTVREHIFDADGVAAAVAEMAGGRAVGKVVLVMPDA